MEFKEHPGYSTQHKRANANFVLDSSWNFLSSSLPLVPGRKRTIEDGRLTGKRPTNSGIKWRFIYGIGIEAWGWKMGRSTGADVEPSPSPCDFSSREVGSIELESRKGPFSIRFSQLRDEFARRNCGTACEFVFVGLLYARIESIVLSRI